MDVSSLLYNILKDFLYGSNVLETWQEQFLVLATTATAFLLITGFLKYLIDFIWGFFHKF